MDDSANHHMDPALSVDRETLEREHQEHRGACGRVAVARWLGIPTPAWTGRVGPAYPAVGPWWTHTIENPAHRLIIRDEIDPDAKSLLLVAPPGWADTWRAHGLTVVLTGWMTRREAATHPDWRDNPHGKRPAWMVRAQHLHHPDEIDWDREKQPYINLPWGYHDEPELTP